MSDAKPWIVESPAPEMSHSDAGFPGRQFSATIEFGGELQVVDRVVKVQMKLVASALPFVSFTPVVRVAV